MERYLRVHLLGPGPRLMKKRTYQAAVSQMLRSAALELPRKIPQVPYVYLRKNSEINAEVRRSKMMSTTFTLHQILQAL